jgi:cytochrome P450
MLTLIPILSIAAATRTVIDFQDILQRFACDNICKIASRFDPACLLPSLPQTKFVQAFEEDVMISIERFNAPIPFPIVWKIKKMLNIGSEKHLRIAISEVQEFAKNIRKEKKHELREKALLDSVDLLSRFLSSGHTNEKFVADIVISLILAERDTTSSMGFDMVSLATLQEPACRIQGFQGNQ